MSDLVVSVLCSCAKGYPGQGIGGTERIQGQGS